MESKQSKNPVFSKPLPLTAHVPKHSTLIMPYRQTAPLNGIHLSTLHIRTCENKKVLKKLHTYLLEQRFSTCSLPHKAFTISINFLRLMGQISTFVIQSSRHWFFQSFESQKQEIIFSESKIQVLLLSEK